MSEDTKTDRKDFAAEYFESWSKDMHQGGANESHLRFSMRGQYSDPGLQKRQEVKIKQKKKGWQEKILFS